MCDIDEYRKPDELRESRDAIGLVAAEISVTVLVFDRVEIHSTAYRAAFPETLNPAML